MKPKKRNPRIPQKKPLRQKTEKDALQRIPSHHSEEMEDPTSDPDDKITEAERKKTLKCMLDVLEYQLKGAAEEVNDLDQDVKTTEIQCQELAEDMQRDENQIQINAIKLRKENLERELLEALEEADNLQNADPYLKDAIVENQLLLDQLDVKQMGGRSETDRFLNSSIDTAEIMELYEEAKKDPPPKKGRSFKTPKKVTRPSL